MTTILTRANRGPGLVTVGPADITGQAVLNTMYTLTPIVLNPVRDDATLAIPVTLELSYDGGTNWKVVRDETLHFGARNRTGPTLPTISYGYAEPPVPTHARGTMDLPRVVSIGWDLTLGAIQA